MNFTPAMFNISAVPQPNEVYIVGAYRTPIGNMGGQYKAYKPYELGGYVVKGALINHDLGNNVVQKIYMGQALEYEDPPNVIEELHKAAEFPDPIETHFIKEDCTSGLKAIFHGYKDIKSNVAQLILCGGQESASQFSGNFRLHDETNDSVEQCVSVGENPVKRGLVIGGLATDPPEVNHLRQAEHLIYHLEIKRHIQDKQTIETIERALTAMKDKLFDEELICFANLYKDETIFNRINESLYSLSCYPPLLQICPLYMDPSITSGNSAQYADGAAALLLCSGKNTVAYINPPLARIVGFVEIKVAPQDLGNAQITAIQRLFRGIHWNENIVDLYEIYEPYAAQSVAVMRALKIHSFRINICGSNLALGDPIGATGARMVVTLVHNLRRLGLKRGIVSTYTPTGIAIAMAIEAC